MLSNQLILCHSLFFCLQFSPASESFPMSQLFPSGGQSIRASASVLPINIQGWFPLGWTDLIPLAVQGTLQHHNSKAWALRLSPFLMVQLPHPYMSTGKVIALMIWTFVGKVMSLLLNTLFRFGIAFLPRSKLLLILWLCRSHHDFGAQEDKICHCSTYRCHALLFF